jgi:2-oxoglutarate ferredoxin oxidoreductase subunit beta
VRAHNAALNTLDFMTGRAPITAEYEPGALEVIELHDGSSIRLRKIAPDHDVHDRIAAINLLHQRAAAGEVSTGLIFVDREPDDLHHHLATVEKPLNTLNEKELCPGSAALDKLNASLR